MNSLQKDYSRERKEMVERQLESRGIHDKRVLRVMELIPREIFVPTEFEHRSYEDNPVPIEAGQTISQPYIVALMLEALNLKPEAKVLEVGSGSGYSTAILSALVDKVYGIERFKELSALARERIQFLGCDNVEIITADGSKGLEAFAPYDSIIVWAAAFDVPPALPAQLKIGGSLVIPVGPEKSQEVLRISRTGEKKFQKENLGGVRFVPLIED